jgi:hypothetical protein
MKTLQRPYSSLLGSKLRKVTTIRNQLASTESLDKNHVQWHHSRYYRDDQFEQIKHDKDWQRRLISKEDQTWNKW